MILQKLCFFIIFFLANSLWAAKWAAPPKDNLGVKFGFNAPQLSMNLQSKNKTPMQEVKYSPNETSSAFLSLSYQNVGLSIGGIQLGRGDKDQAKYDESIANKGSTTHTDYQLRFYGKYASIEFFYQKYKGYFLENSSEIDPSYLGSDNKIKRPDLSTEHWGAQVIYNFNPEDFSMGAAFDQFARQKESGSSWLGLAYVDHHRILANTTWTPSQVATYFPVSKDFDDGLAVTAGIGAGYGFLLTGANFYLSAVIAYGVGPEIQKYSSGTETKEINDLGQKLILRPSIGYNGESHYFGFQILGDVPAYKITSRESINLSTIEITGFYGHRFDGVSIPPAEWVSNLLD